jgi:hypothetical protein
MYILFLSLPPGVDIPNGLFELELKPAYNLVKFFRLFSFGLPLMLLSMLMMYQLFQGILFEMYDTQNIFHF